MAILDFLTDNMDRSHYETIRWFIRALSLSLSHSFIPLTICYFSDHSPHIRITCSIFGANSFTIHYNNGREQCVLDAKSALKISNNVEILAWISVSGRGFGRAYYDELANLAPLVQCCMIRTSTLKALLRWGNTFQIRWFFSLFVWLT